MPFRVDIYYTNCATLGRKRAVEFLIKKGPTVQAVESTQGWTPSQYLAAIDDDSGGHEDWTEDDSLSKLNFIFSTRRLWCLYLVDQ